MSKTTFYSVQVYACFHHCSCIQRLFSNALYNVENTLYFIALFSSAGLAPLNPPVYPFPEEASDDHMLSLIHMVPPSASSFVPGRMFSLTQ